MSKEAPQRGSGPIGIAVLFENCSAYRHRRLPAPLAPEGERLARPAAGAGPCSAARLALALALLCASLAALALSASGAQAAVTHNYLSQITEVPATGPLSEAVPFPGPLTSVDTMTVDSGELYVAEGHGGEYRLDKFNASSGAFTSQFPQAPSLSYLYQGVAVGHATGEAEVYVTGDAAGANGAVAVFDAVGNLQATWTGADTPSGAFGCFECSGAGDVAIDNSTGLTWASGDVYVADPQNAVVDVLEPKAGGGEEYVTQLTGTEPGSPFNNPVGVAVDPSSGDVMVIDGEGPTSPLGNVLDVFEPTAPGEYALLRQLSATPAGPFERVKDVAVDGANGDIYILEGENRARVFQFSSAGEYVGRLAGTPAGPFSDTRSVAVDPTSHNVYIGDYNQEKETGAVDVFGPNLVVPDVETGSASPLRPLEATLNGTVNPLGAGEATCQFAWGTSGEFGKTAPCHAAVPEGTSPVPVHAELTGLQPDTTYFYRLQATNGNGTNPGQSLQGREFTTPGPGIHSTSVSAVSGDSATLEATIDPHNAPTSYYFQYGTDTSYGAEVPAPPGAAIGEEEGDVEVGRHLRGLLPATTYHYRVVAVSEWAPGEVEEFPGPDQIFTTQTPVALGLPDGRQWEMVSPPDKLGALIEPISERAVIQASPNGGAITYEADAPTESEPQGYANQMQVLSTRGGEGWVSRDIEIPFNEPSGFAASGSDYRFFSEDLSLAVLNPFGNFDPSLSPEASGQTPFLRTNYLGGDPTQPCLPKTMHCYRPLVTAASGYANVPEGTDFGGETEGKCLAVQCGPKFVGGTDDGSHLLFTSTVALTSPPVQEGLYEWSGGQLALVSVLPEAGGPVEGALGYVNQNARHAISDDGSRVVWSEPEGGGHLYLRDTVSEESVRLDAVQDGSGINGPSPVFQLASRDGSKVFFTDTQRLTADSGANEGLHQGDLYECEIVKLPGELHCLLSDLTPLIAGESAHVQGGVLGASEDGSYLYFVATGALASGAVRGEPNLYLRHAGVTRLVAVLSSEDSPDWAKGEVNNLNELTARVSSGGRLLAFMSQRPLTGYDNRDAVSGARDEEVYLYDAEAERLICASCDPTGARPHGIEYKKLGSVGAGVGSLVGGSGVWENSTWLAANIPGWTPYQRNRALHQSRYLSDSGRLLFNSLDPLTPQDSNGTWDVYQYEPPGVGDCQSSSPSFSQRSGGCVGLISSGTSAEESGFLDASEDGNDVFLLTFAQLSPGDTDTAPDVYDAHVCTAGSPCPVPAEPRPVECEGDACQQPASPPDHPTPGTSLLNGPGNEHPARKHHHRRHKHGKHHKHHKDKQSRAATTNRRAQR